MPVPQATSLLATVCDPWESLTQTLRDSDTAAFGDPAQPGTPAFHLQHTVAIFRLHARKLIRAIAPEMEDCVPGYDAPVPLTGPWSPEAVLAELQTHAKVFATWLDGLEPGTLERTTLRHSERDQSGAVFLDMMTRHIVWHAAGAYYRARPLPGS